MRSHGFSLTFCILGLVSSIGLGGVSTAWAQHSDGCSTTIAERRGTRTIAREIPNEVLPLALRRTSGGTAPRVNAQAAGGLPTLVGVGPNWKRHVGTFRGFATAKSNCFQPGVYRAAQIDGNVGSDLASRLHSFSVYASGYNGQATPVVTKGIHGVNVYFASGARRGELSIAFPTIVRRDLTHSLGAYDYPTIGIPGVNVSSVSVNLTATFILRQSALLAASGVGGRSWAFASFDSRVTAEAWSQIRVGSKRVGAHLFADLYGSKLDAQATVRTDNTIVVSGKIKVVPVKFWIQRLWDGDGIGWSHSYDAPGYEVQLFPNIAAPAPIGGIVAR
jgi:hypothetical protein